MTQRTRTFETLVEFPEGHVFDSSWAQHLKERTASETPSRCDRAENYAFFVCPLLETIVMAA